MYIVFYGLPRNLAAAEVELSLIASTKVPNLLWWALSDHTAH